MDILNRRFLFVTGKGGVGRTTLSAALGRAGAASGRRTLLATAHSADALSFLMNRPVDSTIRNVAPGLDVLAVDPVEARNEYGRMILRWKPLYKAVLTSTWVNRFLDAVPGLSEWAMLGKVTYHALDAPADRLYDLVVFDGPPTGHALEMLRLPRLIRHVIVSGRLREEAEKRISLFQDPGRFGVVLVASPDDLAACEAMEAGEVIRGELGPVIALLVINLVTRNPFDADEEACIRTWPENDGKVTPLALGQSRFRRCEREGRIIRELSERFPSHVLVNQIAGFTVGPTDLDEIVLALD